jgi:hypothetical protein
VQSFLYSPVFPRNNREIRHVSRISEEKRAEFLCSQDCMAERVGFDNRELCYLSSFEEHQS